MRKEYNLKKLRIRPGKAKADPQAIKTPISLRIDSTVLADLKTQSLSSGIGYQTLIGSILYRYTQGELIDRKSIELLKTVKIGKK